MDVNGKLHELAAEVEDTTDVRAAVEWLIEGLADHARLIALLPRRVGEWSSALVRMKHELARAVVANTDAAAGPHDPPVPPLRAA